MKLLEKPFSPDFQYPQAFIIFLGAIFFIPLLGHFHLFDWDEINFAESAREMIITGDYARVMVDFVPFWEKPPLFFWLQSLSMNAFGVNEFAARFPNALCGLATLIVIYHIGKKLYDHQFGMLWAITYLGALLPHLYFKSGIIDPVFNLFIFLSIWYLMQVIEMDQKKSRNAFLSGIFVGLAILTKGPVGLLIVILTFLVYWIGARFRKVAHWQQVVLLALGAFLMTALWFGPETIKNGPWFIGRFIEYQIRLLSTSDAGHQQPIYYHFVVVLFGCFPFSVFAVRNLLRWKGQSSVPINTDRWMRHLFWVVMILFTIVKTKIVHYSSMAYLPLSFLAVLYVYECIKGKRSIDRLIQYFNMVLGIILSLMISVVAILLIRKDWLLQLIDHASLTVDVPMIGMEYLIGIFYLVGTILVFLWINRGQIQRGLMFHALILGITLFLSSLWIVPKIEAYSQRPAITFYQSLVGKDVYVYPLFKTYAHYFYAKILPDQSTHQHEREWYLKGEIDKPVYLVEFSSRAGHLFTDSAWTHLYTEGDFAFFRRNP
ncbi:MAG: ArnT family glycosyltransferase [Bacteroidota bacterium]